jgi:hypothetical protein
MVQGTQQGTITADRALVLMRLGWAIAELRGRVYFGKKDPGRLIMEEIAKVRRDGHGLPLSEERSPGELLVESKKLVQLLAETAQLDFVGSTLGNQTDPNPSAAKGVISLASRVCAKEADEWKQTWNNFTEALYQWDADIQDTLAGESFGASSAYQLGRALAECSWALDPESGAESFMGWTHILGTGRCLAINRLIDRVTPALPHPQLTSDAIKGSLAAWQRLASDEAWRSDRMAPVYLRDQTIIWRDLLLARIDPRLITQPKASLQRIGSIFPAVKAVWVNLVLSLLGVSVLATGAWLISANVLKGPWGAIIAGLGIFGVTASSLSVGAKATANGLVSQIRKAIQADDIVEACTRRPPQPDEAKVKEPGRLAMPGSVAAPVTLAMLEKN